jgi:methylmalonyl-CoA mutase cobalamin-binding subunit
VPTADIQHLQDEGVAAVITPGASADDVAATIRRTLDLHARA